jgi:RES domain-containing protein
VPTRALHRHYTLVQLFRAANSWDAWLAGGASVALRVPSVVVPSEFNYLLNPKHGDFTRISIGASMPFPFDPRLPPR